MNQQTSYSLKEGMQEKEKNIQNTSSILSTTRLKRFQSMPNIVEITRIMFSATYIENAKEMKLQEQSAYYEVTNEFFSFTHELI